MSSILSYEKRGKWGKSDWRGNCSGFIFRDVFESIKPKIFVDPMMGSGTSIEVAEEMGIDAYGLDLHNGFNILRNSILEAVGKEADLVLSHPPYHDMVVYSGAVWGNQPHPDDLSRCESVGDFNEKLHLALLNQREAARPGGFYGMIIGDMRRKGKYHSFQAEQIARLPGDELASVIIKAQHNCWSDNRRYAGMKLPRIMHEYIVLWQKPNVVRSILSSLVIMVSQAQQRLTSTWKVIVKQSLIELGGEADLSRIYEKVAQNAPDRLANNNNWKAKVRQTLNQNHQLFVSEERGLWGIAA